jgi:GNAT superfamily N-acetyltransferase
MSTNHNHDHHEDNQPEFRMAIPSDIPFLHTFVNNGYRGDTARLGWTHEANLLDGQRVDEQMLREIIVDGIADNVILLLLHQTTILSSVHLQYDEKNQACHLGMFVVLPTAQNQGIGKKMLQHVCQIFVPKRWPLCKIVEMTVIKQRAELISYYLRRGFVLVPNWSEPFPYHDERFGLPKRPDLEFIKLIYNLSS